MRIRPQWVLSLIIPIGLMACSARGDTAAREPLAPVIPGSPMVINALMGSINGTPVFVDDILKPIDTDLRALAKNPKETLSLFRADAHELISRQVEALVDDLLIASSANDALDATDNQRIDLYMNRIKKDLISKNGGVEERLRDKLKAQGISLEQYMDQQRRVLVRQLFMEKTFDPRIQVTREQVLADYNQHIKDYTVPAQIEMFTITLPVANWLPQEVDPADPTQKRPKAHPTADEVKQAVGLAMAKAQDLIKQLKDGADFATLAGENSRDRHAENGGRWTKLKRGELSSQAWEDLAFGLKANTIGEPILINGDQPGIAGVVITKVGDVSPAHVVPFSEAQAAIRKTLHDRQSNVLTGEYLQNIRQKAAIEGIDRMINTATDAAVSRYVSQ